METEFFNLYVEHSLDNRFYKIALNLSQINRVVNAFLNGVRTANVKGVSCNISNPRKFIIYSITDTTLGKEQAGIESNIIKWKRIEGGRLNMNLLSRFGTNVTDNFTHGKGWGEGSEIQLQVVTTNNLSGKIFISHAIKDSEIVRKFTEDILQIGLNINPQIEVFNISIEDAGIKTGEDFRKRIETELKTAKAVIQIITENYKKSEACLNEMGAAWVLNVPVIPFIIEPIEFSTVGFIHNPNQLLKLNGLKDIQMFISQYKGVLFSASYDDAKVNRKIIEFITFLNKQAL